MRFRFAVLVFAAAFSGSAFAEAEQTPPVHYVSAEAGLALTASGSIIDSSWGGLHLLELLINANVLYAPRVSPALRYTGPIYRIPDFDLSSHQAGITYERRYDHWFLGGSFRYTDITARVDIPETFIVAPQLGFNFPFVSRVTPELHDRIILASVFQAEGSAAWHWSPDSFLDPYGRVYAGAGKGWVAHFGGGPYIHEIHAGAGAGLRLNLDDYFIGCEVNVLGHWVNSGSSSFIDRTDVLVNPGNGSIYIVRALLNAGIRF